MVSMSTITPEEQADINVLKAEIVREKQSTYDYCKLLLSMPPDQLIKCGHRNGNDKAVADTLRASLTRVEKLSKAFLKKWPDAK